MFAQIKIAMYLLLAAAIAAAYWYYTWSQKEIQVLRANAVTMKLAIKLNEEAIESMKADVLKSRKIADSTGEKFKKARAANKELRKKLAKHNLGFLAKSKPGIVQRIINKGTADANRCVEILSGSPLTESEKTATKKSQANTSCPDIANPLYVPRAK